MEIFGAGGVAQLGEHLLCKQGVVGSSPITSTSYTSVAIMSFNACRFRATCEALYIVNRNANRTPLSEFEVPGLGSKHRVFDDLTVL